MWYLIQAKEAGAKIISIDPRYTDTAAVLAQEWVPIRPGTDCAMLIAMANVIVEENLQDQAFLDRYTFGFEVFRDYVLGKEDGVAKTPEWAEGITGVPSATIRRVAREYATIKPAALMAGIAPGRTAYGEQYHRAAITLAAMTGNVGIHGGDASGRAWESVYPGYPYPINGLRAMRGLLGRARNPVVVTPAEPKAATYVKKFMPYTQGIHGARLADAILKGKAGGYPHDYKLLYVAHCNYVTQWPNVNKIVQALQLLEFIVVQEQFLTPTAKFADILLPVNTFLERNDITLGVGTVFIGRVNKAIDSIGESKSPLEIAIELGKRLGIYNLVERDEEELLEDFARQNGVPDYAAFKKDGVYKLELEEPYVAFKKQIEDPVNHPFPTPSGKIEIYCQRLADLNISELPPIPKYIESWEGKNDPLAKKYPLQLITTHFRRRALSQFDNIPWLKELEEQALLINVDDARARNIRDGDMVKVFNERGEIMIRARVTERIMPGVVDVPHGAWYSPEGGVDMGGCANVLTADEYSPSGGYVYNTALVEVTKI
jgi:anaerobic dimethyl sulfoxide reductase subunit A